VPDREAKEVQQAWNQLNDIYAANRMNRPGRVQMIYAIVGSATGEIRLEAVP
jgi:hypothetical protein